MRAILFAAFVLFASAAQAQNIWQMNAAYQNQINQAQQSAWPAYGYGYAPVYRPAYVAPRRYGYGRYSDNYIGSPLWLEQRRQTRALRDIDNTLQIMSIRSAPRPGSVLESQMRDSAWMYEK